MPTIKELMAHSGTVTPAATYSAFRLHDRLIDRVEVVLAGVRDQMAEAATVDSRRSVGLGGIDSAKQRTEQRLERNVGVVLGIEYPSAARNEVVEDRAEKLDGEEQGLERASTVDWVARRVKPFDLDRAVRLEARSRIPAA